MTHDPTPSEVTEEKKQRSAVDRWCDKWCWRIMLPLTIAACIILPIIIYWYN